MNNKHTQARPPRPLPGEASINAEIRSMIRVDHAGEYAATRIYDGQLAVLGARHRLSKTIRHMAGQEEEHLAKFDQLIAERGVRPTVMNPIWGAASFALGAVTALMGERAAMACTAAVEEVIDEHYRGQEEHLSHWDVEPDLNDTISRFRADEVEHRETALRHGAEETPGYALLSGAIKSGCRAAIWLSKRV